MAKSQPVFTIFTKEDGARCARCAWSTGSAGSLCCVFKYFWIAFEFLWGVLWLCICEIQKSRNIVYKFHNGAGRKESDIPLVCNRCCLKEMCYTDVFKNTNELRSCYEDCKAGSVCNSDGVLNQKGLHFKHVKARSVLPRLDEVGSLCPCLRLIVVSETWLDGLPGYYDYWSQHTVKECLT